MRYAVDAVSPVLACGMASLAGFSLLIGSFGTASLSAYLAFAVSVFTLLAAGALTLVVVVFVASLIALAVDRPDRTQ